MANGEAAALWVELIAAGRKLAERAEDPSVSAGYGTRYGMALLTVARGGTVTGRRASS